MESDKELNRGYGAMANEELLALYQATGEHKIKQELAMRYLYIVKSIAIQMRDVYVGFTQLDDIVHEGVLALMGAIDKYDPEKNTKFETYISKRLRGMIIDIARKQDWIPRNVRKSFRDINDAQAAFSAKNGRMPTDTELAGELHMEQGRLHDIMSKSNLFSVLSLDMVLEETSEKHRSVQIPSENKEEQPEEHYLEKEFKTVLANGVKSLKENEQLVVSLYYVEELSMKHIASVMQVSEPRISQIHANAIRKLQKYMEETMKRESQAKEEANVSGIL